ncbi:DUF2737 family protein [Escherichia coli]|nr:DUF2737 family protein [Escherichia coli]EEZ8328859.1 DUF2737 family protein [Escherichia coli]EFB9594717.1 DUF2737 family protein [Escherichia coli]EFB9905065.1 DUF2737 family protein [Escherichia coli]EFC3537591.1 DUF2737 family protein [Escherichia coli]
MKPSQAPSVNQNKYLNAMLRSGKK